MLIASQKDHSDVVQVLLQAGADVNIAMSDSSTPLHTASYNGHHEVVKTMLRGGVKANITRSDTNATALYMASENGHFHVVQTLLEAGTDVNIARSDNGCSPLMTACFNGHLDVVKALIQAGANVNQGSKDNSTPLYVACQNGHQGIIQVLLEVDANMNISRSNDGWTPLMIAIDQENNLAVDLLIKACTIADLYQTNKDGKTAVDLAAEKNHQESIEMINRKIMEKSDHSTQEERKEKNEPELCSFMSLDPMAASLSSTQTEQEMPNIEQSKEQIQQQLDTQQLRSHIEQDFKATKQQKEQTEDDSLMMQIGEMEYQLLITKQQLSVVIEQNLQSLRLLEQKDALLKQMKLQASIAEERAKSTEQELKSLRQKAEMQLTCNMGQLSFHHIYKSPEYMRSPWMVDRSEIQVIQEKPLGVGGWGEVKVATFRGLKVAAKFLHDSILSPHNVDMFIREMNIAASVRHPNLLLFIGASFDENTRPVIITELMSTNLRFILRSLSHDQIVSVSMDVACGLNYLHLMKPEPVIHRDISSANVLLEPIGFGNWRAKVSDYGSANFISKVSTIAPGNAFYAAPESSDPRLQSSKMDVYSYGILLLEMATGQFPEPQLQGIQLEALAWHEMTGIIRKCICQEPSNRPEMNDIIFLLPKLKT